MSKSHNGTARMVQLAVLIAILAVLTMTGLGYINYGVVSITILHIPVIIASLLLGAKEGAIVGFAFGLTSMLNATFRGVTPVDLMFTPFGSHNMPVQSIIMCFVPRILLGLVPAVLQQFFARFIHQKPISCGLAALLSTVMHTVLVLGCLYFMFFPEIGFTESISAIFGTVIGVNGVLEALSAAILAPLIAIPVKKALHSELAK